MKTTILKLSVFVLIFALIGTGGKKNQSVSFADYFRQTGSSTI